MKITMLLLAMSFITSTAYARECKTNARGEVDWKTMCRLDGSSYLIKQCTEKKVPGEAPGTFKYISVPKKIGWGNVMAVDTECDISIHECKALAEKMLEEYSFTDECGQEAVMKKVKFKFDVLNELSLEFKTLHKGSVRK